MATIKYDAFCICDIRPIFPKNFFNILEIRGVSPAPAMILLFLFLICVTLIVCKYYSVTEMAKIHSFKTNSFFCARYCDLEN